MPIALAVASPGGHFDELHTLVPHFVSGDHTVVWVTSATAQTRSVLSGHRVEWVRAVGARQGLKAAGSVPHALRLMRRHRPSVVVSTGAALSFPYLVAARLYGIETHFIDSATRLDGPSLTGRMSQWVPGIHLHCQGTWEEGRWRRTESVFDSFEIAERPYGTARRILVTLGSERFPFPRAVEAIARSVPYGAEVVWQLGHTPAPPALPGTVHAWLPFEELVNLAEEADVVLSHCGVGSILMALRAGKSPVVVARQALHKEHVDDHQRQLATSLGAAGIALVADADLGNVSTLISRAARKIATPRESSEPRSAER